MKIPFFNELNTKSLQDSYWIEINFEERKLSLDLNFENSSIHDENLNQVINILENLDKTVSKVKNFINKDFQEGTEVNEYLDDHLEVLKSSDLEYLLKSADKKLSPKQQLFSVLKLTRIGFYPEDEKHYSIFDFELDQEISQYLLVVYLNKKGELDHIATES